MADHSPMVTASVLCVLAVLAGGCTSGHTGTAATASGSATNTPSASPSGASPVAGGAAALEQAYVSVVHDVLPSIVQIRTSSGLGSGVVFDNSGNIVTNAHVVGTARRFSVVPANSTTPLDATLVGTFAPDDLAVIRATGGSLQPARFGDSRALQVGDIVLAMGNPLGLSSSVTNGIVSALGRTVSEPGEQGAQGATLPNVIQTSAAINPGNSGGGLVNLSGEVIGIPTLAAVDPEIGSGSAAPGIGFAIPSSIVSDIAGQLVKNGRVTNSHRAALGVQVTTVAGPDGSPAGVGIVSVTSGGAADKAGIRAGDVIDAVNGSPTPDTSTLSTVLADLAPGQTVPVKTTSSGQAKTMQVTLGELAQPG